MMNYTQICYQWWIITAIRTNSKTTHVQQIFRFFRTQASASPCASANHIAFIFYVPHEKAGRSRLHLCRSPPRIKVLLTRAILRNFLCIEKEDALSSILFKSFVRPALSGVPCSTGAKALWFRSSRHRFSIGLYRLRVSKPDFSSNSGGSHRRLCCLLTEITLEQSRKRLAVAGFVARHLSKKSWYCWKNSLILPSSFKQKSYIF